MFGFNKQPEPPKSSFKNDAVEAARGGAILGIAGGVAYLAAGAVYLTAGATLGVLFWAKDNAKVALERAKAAAGGMATGLSNVPGMAAEVAARIKERFTPGAPEEAPDEDTSKEQREDDQAA